MREPMHSVTRQVEQQTAGDANQHGICDRPERQMAGEQRLKMPPDLLRRAEQQGGDGQIDDQEADVAKATRDRGKLPLSPFHAEFQAPNQQEAAENNHQGHAHPSGWVAMIYPSCRADVRAPGDLCSNPYCNGAETSVSPSVASAR